MTFWINKLEKKANFVAMHHICTAVYECHPVAKGEERGNPLSFKNETNEHKN